MKKQNNTTLWIIGIIILLLVVAPKIDIKFPFAVVTKIVCTDNTLSYFDLETNVLDELGINNGLNYGGIFVPGRLGESIEFNTTTYVDFPTISSSDKTIVMWIKNYSTVADWYFASETNGTSGTNSIIPLGAGFGFGLNGSVDEIAVFSPALTSEELSNLSIGVKVCYTVSYEENVSCKDYTTELVTDPGYGCLNYSGDFFPHCDYEWLNDSQYKIEENQCMRSFYCQSPCLNISNCYLSNQSCIENLEYDCYIIINNVCTHKTDYENCTGTDYYVNLTECQANLTTITPPSTTPPFATTTPSITPPEEPFLDKLKFEVFGYEITMLQLIILLGLVGVGLYFINDAKKK